MKADELLMPGLIALVLLILVGGQLRSRNIHLEIRPSVSDSVTAPIPGGGR